MLSTKALRYAFKAAKREGGFVERRPHGRVIREGGEQFPHTVEQLAEAYPKFKVPTWVFAPDDDVEEWVFATEQAEND